MKKKKSSVLPLLRSTLANGLEVLIRERRTAPVVATMLWYRVGSRDEDPGETGRSHFLEHMLFKGTDRYTKGEIDGWTAVRGGKNNAFTCHDATAYHFAFASDRWRLALEIEASRMTGTLFDRREFEAERAVVLEELRMTRDEPWHALIEDVESTLFRAHPYHVPVIGYAVDLAPAPVEEMESYYRRFYRPDNAFLVIVGDVDAQLALAEVEATLGRVPRPEAPLARRRTTPEPSSRGERRLMIERDVALERVTVAWRIPEFGHADEAPLRVLAALLADGKGSRLYRRLVEGKKLFTDVGAQLDARRDPGPFYVFGEVASGISRSRAEKALLAELEAIGAKAPAAAEVERARRRLLTGHAIERETMLGEAETLGFATLYGAPEASDRLAARLASVTGKDLQRVARGWLEPAMRTIGWLVKGERGGAEVETEPAAETGDEAAPRLDLGGVVAPKVHLGFRREALSNGLVVLATDESAGDILAIELELPAGSQFDDDRHAGLACLAGRMLDQGSERWSADEIADRIERRGGDLEIETRTDRTRLRYVGERGDLEFALELLAELVARSRFPAARLGLQRGLLLDEIRSDGEDPRTVAFQTLNELIFAGHPWHRPVNGYAATLLPLKRADVLDFHRRHHRPQGSRLAVTGGGSADQVLRAARHAFAGWKSAAPAIAIAGPTRRPAARRRVDLPREQTHIAVGHLGVARRDPRFFAAQIVDMVLGAAPGFVSRVPRVLRDQMGLAYVTWADLTASAGPEPGRLVGYIATAPANEQRALAALRGEIARLAENGATADEIEQAKAYLTGRFVFQVETAARRVGVLLDLERNGLGAADLAGYTEQVMAVSKAEVDRAARELLRPKDLCVAVVGAPRAARRKR